MLLLPLLPSALLLWWAAVSGRAGAAAALVPGVLGLIMLGLAVLVLRSGAGEGVGTARIALEEIAFAPGRAVRIGGDPVGDALVLGSPDAPPLPASLVIVRRDGDALAIDISRRAHGRLLARVDVGGPSVLPGTVPVGRVGEGPLPCAMHERSRAAPVPMRPGALFAAPGFGTLAPGGSCRPLPEGEQRFRLRNDERILAIAGPADRRVSAGQALRLRLYRVVAPVPPIPGLAAEPGRLVLLLDADVLLREGAIAVRPRRPAVQQVAGALEESRPILLTGRAGLRQPTEALADAAVFPLLGARFEPALASVRLETPGAGDGPFLLAGGKAEADGSDLVVATDEGRLMFALGLTAPGRGQLAALPWLAMGALLIGSLASFGLRRRCALAAVLFGALEALLLVRFLMAVEAELVAPSSDLAPLPADALLALLVAPLALRLAWPDPRAPCALPLPVLLAWLVAAGAAAGAILLLPVPPGTSGVVAAGALGILALGACFARAQWGPAVAVRRKLEPLHRALSGPGGGDPGPAWRRVRALPAPWLWALLALGVIFAVRLLVPGEQLPGLPVRLSVSLFLVPLTLLAAALLLAPVGDPAGPRPGDWRTLLGLALLLGGGIGLASWLVRDSGFAILGWPVAAAAALAFILRTSAAERRSALVLAALLAVALVIALAGWFQSRILQAAAALALAGGLGLVALVRPRWRAGLWTVPALAIAAMALIVPLLPFVSPAASLPDIAGAATLDRNEARLLGAFAPGRLAAHGTSLALEFQSAIDVGLAHAAEGGWLGAGWLGRADMAGPLGPTRLSDHAAAVHLLLPFGMVGAAIVLSLHGAVAAAAVTRVRPAMPVFAWLGLLSALALALVSAWMLFANLGALPFTGRNMLLLSPVSAGDLVEGWILLLLVAMGLAPAGPAAEPGP